MRVQPIIVKMIKPLVIISLKNNFQQSTTSMTGMNNASTDCINLVLSTRARAKFTNQIVDSEL